MRIGTQPLEETTQLVAQRVSLGLGFMATANVALGIGDLTLARPSLPLLLGIKAVSVFGLCAGIWLLRRAPTWRTAVSIGLAGSGVAYAMGSLSGILTQDVVTVRLSGVTVAMGSALLVPWGTLPQLASVAMAVLSVLINTYFVLGGVGDLYEHPAIIVVVIGLVASVYGSGQSHQTIGQRDLARRRAEDERDSFFEISPDLVCVGDASGRFTKLNAAWERHLGWSRQEVMARPWIELVHPEDRERTLQEATTRGIYADRQFFNRWRHKDGSYRWLSWSSSRRVGGSVYAVARDVTEQRAVAEALRASEARLRALIETAGTPILVLSSDARLVDLNPAAEQVLGWKREEAIERDVVDLVVPPDLRREGRDILARILKGDLVDPFEVRLLNRSGDPCLFLLTATRLLGPAEVVTGVVVIAQDITHRKRVEAYRTALLELAKDIGGTRDRDQLLERVQRRAALTLPCDRVLTFAPRPGADSFSLCSQYGIPPELVDASAGLEFPLAAAVTRHLLAGNTLVVDGVPASPWFEEGLLERFGVTALVAVPFQVQGRVTGVVAAILANRPGVAFDTEQVHLFEGMARQLGVAMEAAQLAHAREEENVVSAALARVGSELISSLEPEPLMARLCRVTVDVLGCDASHTYLPRGEDDTFVAVASSGDSPARLEALRAIRFNGAMVEPLLKALSIEDVVELSPGRPLGLPPGLFRAFGNGNSLVIGLRRGDRLIGVQTATKRGPQGSFTALQRRIARAIGRLASMALESAQLFEELQRANRFKADFLATMSHELRTPLNVIIGYSELLCDGTFGEMSPEQVDTVERIRRNSRDLLQMVNATLDLSRFEGDRMPLRVERIDVAALLADLREGMRQLAAPGVDLIWEEDPHLALVSDPIKLRMILENLLGNALKFTSDGWVRVRARRDGEAVEVVVQDTGIGIPKASLVRIFEPFQQGGDDTNARYGGAGLGLYIVQRLVSALGGTVRVSSETGDRHGSRFSVRLPDLGGATPPQRRYPEATAVL